MNGLLEQGIAAVRAGQREEARDILTRLVEVDERNEQAWLWLSGVLDDPEDVRICLENVLDLNPANTQAQQGLKWLESRYGPRPVSAPAPTPQPVALEVAAPLPVQTPAMALPHAATHTTRNLGQQLGAVAASAMALPAALPTAPAVSAPVAPAAPAAEQAAQPDAVTMPCPYCGTATVLSQSSCPKCGRSLMMRDAPRPKRSLALTILAIFWALGGIGMLLVLAMFTFATSALLEMGLDEFAEGRGVRDWMLVGFVVVALFYFAMAYGLWIRNLAAYVIHCIAQALNSIGVVVQIVSSAAILGTILTMLPPQRQSIAVGTIATVLVVVSILWTLLPLILTVVAWRDFFGPKVRIDTEIVPLVDHRIHFNNGLSWKNKGMWYLAMKEWELASLKAPTDLAAAHALALAYAQMSQFDQARATINRAIDLAPGNAQLEASRATIEHLAKKSK
ncbi:MAG TPA: hypothetical protein VFS21_10560 [Roseiflexaceae bacterium]|nr:hypothetical protein [Roseiflexaceae bacterium]